MVAPRAWAGVFLLVAGLALTGCQQDQNAAFAAGSATPTHTATPDPDHPGYQRYQDSTTVTGRIGTLHVSGGMDLTVRTGTTASVRRTVEFKDTDPGPNTWRLNGSTLDLSACPVNECRISYAVTVPATTALTGEVDSGTVDVRGIASANFTGRSGEQLSLGQISGAVTLNAQSTKATVTDIGGPASITTSSTQLTATNLHAGLSVHGESAQVTANGITGPVTLDLQSATVALAMAAAANLTVSLTSGSAMITVPHSAYHVVSSTNSAELTNGVPDTPGAPNQISLTLTSANAQLAYA